MNKFFKEIYEAFGLIWMIMMFLIITGIFLIFFKLLSI